MAAREDKAEPVIGEAAVAPEAHVILLSSAVNEGALDPGELLRLPTRPSDSVECPVARRGRDPGPGIPRNAIPRPGFEGRHERVREGLLGEVEVAQDTDERGKDAPGFLAERPLDVLADRVGDQPVAPAPAVSGISMSRSGRTSIEP